MAFGFKHKIAALLVPIVGASIINLPTVASAMEKSDVSINFGCEITRGGSNPNKVFFTHSAFPVRLSANVSRLVNVGIADPFDYAIKNLSVSFPSRLPGSTNPELTGISHARINLPNPSGVDNFAAEAAPNSGGIVTQSGKVLALSGGATSDDVASFDDLAKITEPKGIQGTRVGDAVNVKFPDTTLKVPAQNEQRELKFVLPETSNLADVNSVTLTAAGTAINGNERLNVVLRCIPASFQSPFPTVNIVSQDAAAIRFLNFGESVRTAVLNQSNTLTGVALKENGKPAPKDVPIILDSDEHLGSYSNAQALTDENGIFRFEFTARSDELYFDGGFVDLFARVGGLTSPKLRLNTVAENKAGSAQVNPESIDVNPRPGTITIGGTTTIEVTLNFANGIPENLPESIQITIDGSPVQVMRKGKTNVYSTTYTPTTTGLKIIGATFGNASAFAALDVTEKNNPPSGGSSSSVWKIVAGVVGALGLIGALIAGALNFLPRAFKF
ncbi:hypothetical protein CMUST_02140 [Corynebacterium mustelae]|uniref:Bacterial Ig-like domain-containing protein n=1 Tax=Corynebacterium mustelae TaxID=571915 RepID=A0A0G3H126_9CORY|nr:hypothetical protein [Corynebacterium mustelae]AKK04772.1 hypothetical protein CMUST_02140 [Corynebacterium mustelae]